MDEKYRESIEKDFQEKVDQHESTRGRKNATGREAVLKYLIEATTKIWHWSWEFVGKVTRDGSYLSHRAPARASDLAIHEPDLVEDRKIGRFKVYRLKRENMDKVQERLNQENGGQIEKAADHLVDR